MKFRDMSQEQRIGEIKRMLSELPEVPEFSREATRETILKKAKKWNVTIAEFADDDSKGGHLVTEDSGEKHLPTKRGGNPDHGLMGAAHAALHGGFRGKKYEGPGKDEAIAKLKGMYKSEGMDWPGDSKQASEACLSIWPFAAHLMSESLEFSAIGKTPEGETIYEHPVMITGDWVKGKDIRVRLDTLQSFKKNFEKRQNGEVNLDYDHASENTEVAMGGPIPSAGRVVGMSIKPTDSRHVLFGNYVFTPKAEGLIKNKEYRFISPAFQMDYQDKKTGSSQGPTITSVALTNKPFLEEIPPLQLRETFWTPSAVLMTELGGITMTKQEQIDGMKVRASELEKQGKADEAKKVLAEATALQAAENEPLSDKHPKLSIKKMADGPRKGGFGVHMGGKAVGYLSAADVKACASDGADDGDADDKKKMSEAIREFKESGLGTLTMTDIKSLVNKGREAIAKEAKVDGKKVLCSEAVTDGVLDKAKATFVGNTHREVTMEDYIAVDRANDVLAQAVRDGKLAPTHRKELFSDVVGDPDKWKKLFASAVPLFNVDRGAGIPGATDGHSPTAEDEVAAKTKQVMTEKKIENYGDAMRVVLSENQDLAARYNRERAKA